MYRSISTSSARLNWFNLAYPPGARSPHLHPRTLALQLAFIPGPGGRRDLGPGFSSGGESDEGGSSGAKIGALKEAVYTEVCVVVAAVG